MLRFCLPIALVAAALGFAPAANAQVYVSLFAPPPMPSYSMPYASEQNSIWTPGYWAWGPAGYYWVPGTYVQPPSLGMYWTPGYWGANQNGAGYAWNQGYWGPQVGFYGGINYGGGYYGNGYVGGNWIGNAFSYNTAVTPVNPTVIRNVYVNKTVIVRNVNRYSYNGPGGVRMHPDARQVAIAREHHVAMTPVQRAHIQEAAQDRNLLAKVNGGKPPETVLARPLSASNRPADFKPVTTTDKASVNAKMAPAHPMQAAPAAKPAAPEHAKPAPAHPQQPAGKPAEMKPAAKPAQPPHAQPPHAQQPHAQPQGKPAANAPHEQPAPKKTPHP